MKWLRTTAVAVVFFSLVGGITEAARFTVVNRTDDDLYEMYVTSHGKMTWGKDILRGRILRKHTQDSLEWNTGNIIRWDMRALDAQGREYSWIDVDIRDIDKITLYNIKAKAEATQGYRQRPK